MTKIVLGVTYKDAVTGFEGVAFGHVEYLSGCHQTLIIPRVSGEGNYRDSQWFDDQRLTVVPTEALVTLDNSETPGAGPQAPKR